MLTSGNLADEPIASTTTTPLGRLGRLADALLAHDRPDPRAVRRLGGARSSTGAELPIRRSRGYAPLPVPLPVEAPRRCWPSAAS